MVKLKRDSIEESYLESRKEIFDKIIRATPPDSLVNIERQYDRSMATLGKYVTLDYEHKSAIANLRRTIRYYAADITRKRPLSIIMIAQPGSGKSHFIKCLADKLSNHNISAVSVNMANIENIGDLIQPLDAVRNLKVRDQTPILFLDEFDSNYKNVPLLLPLLWDGELQIGHRDLKLGKVIIILAGSDTNIIKTMEDAGDYDKVSISKIPENKKKMVDLLSRINGGIFEIPGLEIVTSSRDRRVDKVCIALSLLQQRFGPDFQLVPWHLLHFIAVTKFRHGIRSIEHMIDLIPTDALSQKGKRLKPQFVKFPFGSLNEFKKSSLALHIFCNKKPNDIINTWNKISAIETLVRFRPVIKEDM